VHVVYLIDSLIAGGAERSLAALTPCYLQLGIDLDVAFLYERDNVWRRPIEDAGAEVISLAGSGGRIGSVLRTAQLLRTLRPDVLHTTLFDADITGRVASLSTRVPVVCSLVNETYGPDQLRDLRLSPVKVRAAQFIDATTAHRVRRFHAVSNSVADTMARRLRIPRERIDVVPRGRNPHDLGTRTDERRRATRESLNVDNDTLLALSVGRHEFQKGFDVLLRAFHDVRRERKAVLLIAGRDGTETFALRTLADELDLSTSVSFLGFRRDVADLMCAADVFVSSSRWEGSPGSVIEAMALETPIVASDIAAVSEVLGDGGTLVPVGDQRALAEAIARVDADPDTTTGMARAARQRFLDRFTVERVADAMSAFYRRAVEG
jgi:glycosyltransferase involved in cell wall biosynthesis